MDGRLKVLQLVNDANDHLRLPITLDNVDMSLPVKKQDGAGVDRNTGVQLQGIPGMGYKGSVEVFYNRHDLDELFGGAGVIAKARTNGEITAQWLIDQLNVKYGLYLELAEVEDFVLPEFPSLETTHPIEIVVKEHSWNWAGTVTVETTFGNPLLESVVIVRLLPVLVHPVDPKDLGSARRSGYMTTWNFDFTAYKSELLIDPRNGRWANFNRVREIGALAGLPAWNNNGVQDMPTSAVPGSNTKFQRVMVQPYASGSVLAPIMFHYDLNW